MVTATQLYNKSYEVTFIMMVCITVLTYIRSIQTNPESKYSLALQLSSFVTMIASMHYYLMIQNKNNSIVSDDRKKIIMIDDDD